MVGLFDYSADESAHEFTSAAANPAGDCAVVGSFNKFHIFCYSARRGAWEEVGVKTVSLGLFVWGSVIYAVGCKAVGFELMFVSRES